MASPSPFRYALFMAQLGNVNEGSAQTQVESRLPIDAPPGQWLLEDESVPETPLHDAIIELLMLVLKQWARQQGRPIIVSSNLGCRWEPADARVGIDPDVVLLDPPPPEGERLTTLRVWEPNHHPPRIAVEVVSENTADKDYLDAAARCARLGVQELWVFDPRLAGPSTTGGPFPLQLWRAEAPRSPLQRRYAGPGPAFSQELDAWLLLTNEGTRLRIAHDPEGNHLWPTEAEAERERAQAERERAQAERARADAAEAEVERLRALLERKE